MKINKEDPFTCYILNGNEKLAKNKNLKGYSLALYHVITSKMIHQNLFNPCIQEYSKILGVSKTTILKYLKILIQENVILNNYDGNYRINSDYAWKGDLNLEKENKAWKLAQIKDHDQIAKEKRSSLKLIISNKD